METIWHDILYAARGCGGTLSSLQPLSSRSHWVSRYHRHVHSDSCRVTEALEYAQPDQLVLLSGGATSTRFEEMKTGARSFTELAAYSGPESLTLTGGGEPEVLTGFRVSADFLHVLHINPVVGRSFLPAEDAAGAPRS